MTSSFPSHFLTMLGPKKPGQVRTVHRAGHGRVPHHSSRWCLLLLARRGADTLTSHHHLDREGCESGNGAEQSKSKETEQDGRGGCVAQCPDEQCESGSACCHPSHGAQHNGDIQYGGASSEVSNIGTEIGCLGHG